ncbi:RlpA-like double-psi beta-barrel-protein domain-containing protein-containing protein [Cyathus striatus]|nr:RlpA-like double-psi beta-barrel-protein domain-containing protein-containing protein [Cyathus striatus]
MVSFNISTAFAFMLAAAASVNALTGEATWYEPTSVGDHRGIGACGTRISDWDYSTAVSYKLFDTYPGAGPNPNNNPICGRSLRATYEGKSVTVKVVDRCADCEGTYNVDMTKIAFQKLADLDIGRLRNVQWNWV